MSFREFELGIPAGKLQQDKQLEAAHQLAQKKLTMWKQSEAILGILRTIKPTANQPTRELIDIWYKKLPSVNTGKKVMVSPDNQGFEGRPTSACEWFDRRFPGLAEVYGPAFLEKATLDPEGLNRITPIFLNDDFFAAALGGEKALGHELVYCKEEQRFYFSDPMVDAFCPTSEEKVEFLISNYLMRCSQECCYAVVKEPLVAIFRQKKQLKAIVEKAKALLEADSTFFYSKDGKRRYVAGRYIEPTDEPSYRLFVKTALVRHPDARMTLSDAYSRYYRFCGEVKTPPLARSDFKALIKEAIRETFNLGFRHDVPDGEGKQQHGWYGIQCCLPVLSAVSRN